MSWFGGCGVVRKTELICVRREKEGASYKRGCADSDTANRRTATDNDAAKCASVVGAGPRALNIIIFNPGGFTLRPR